MVGYLVVCETEHSTAFLAGEGKEIELIATALTAVTTAGHSHQTHAEQRAGRERARREDRPDAKTEVGSCEKGSEVD